MEIYNAAKRTINEQPTYFSASDGGIEHTLTRNPGLFENSLVYNLLFSEGGIVIPDIFFFNCEPLIRHAAQDSRGRWPFALEALRRGLLIPAFRSEGITTFEGALEAIGKEKILGMEYEQYVANGTSPDKIASSWDKAATQGGTNALRKVWPDAMGEAFGTLLTDTLSAPDLPRVVRGRHQEHWSQIKGWRETIPELARTVTEAKKGLGIRRAEVWNTLGNHLKIVDAGHEFAKPRDLVAAVDQKRDKALSGQVRFFVDVVNIVYQQSQARGFESWHNSLPPLSDVSESVFPNQVNWPNRPGVLQFKVQVPTVKSILSVDPHKVLDERVSGAALGYFSARSAWTMNRDPLHDTRLAENVQQHARSYADALTKMVRGERDTLTIAVLSSGTGLGAGALFDKAVDYMINDHNLSAEYGLLVGALTAGATFYLKHQPREAHRLQINRAPETGTPVAQ